MNSDRLDESAVQQWRNLILATGAVHWIEELINDRVATARKALDGSRIDDVIMAGLVDMAGASTLLAA
jgi:geranylgeranyl diphosphate synthase type I